LKRGKEPTKSEKERKKTFKAIERKKEMGGGKERKKVEFTKRRWDIQTCMILVVSIIFY
jgi:hypothetical protein